MSAVAMVGASVWLSALPTEALSERSLAKLLMAKPVAFVGIVFFGFAGLLALRQLILSPPALEISDWGIKDFRMKVQAPWSRIKRAWVWTQVTPSLKIRYIALDVDLPNDVAKPRFAQSLNQAVGAPPVILQVHTLPGGYRAVLEAIGKFRPEVIG